MPTFLLTSAMAICQPRFITTTGLTMKGKHLIEVCEVCLSELDGFEAHLIEAFETTDQIICDACWADACDAHADEVAQ